MYIFKIKMRLRWDSNPQPLNCIANASLEVQCAIHCATEPPVALGGNGSFIAVKRDAMTSSFIGANRGNIFTKVGQGTYYWYLFTVLGDNHFGSRLIFESNLKLSKSHFV